ncbi:MAG: cyclase family protein [Thermoplasmatales archaeon]
MKIHDLSIYIEDGMPYFEGDPVPSVKQFKSIEEDGYNLKSINIGSHTGTHIDAPSHFIPGGMSVEDLSLDRLCGFGAIIKYDPKEGLVLPEQKFDIILLYTGYNERWGEYKVFRDFSYIKEEDAEEIRKYGVNVVGIDSPSVEPPNSKTFLTHKILLGSSIVIIENLNSKEMAGIIGKSLFVLVFPILLKGGDGAPSRVVALEGYP